MGLWKRPVGMSIWLKSCNHFHTLIRIRDDLQAAEFEDEVYWSARATATNPGGWFPYGCGRVSAFGFVQTQNEREWMDVGQNIQSEKMMRYYWKVIVWPRQASSTRNTRNWAWLRGSVDSVHFGVHSHRDLDVPYIFGDCGMLSVRLLITTVVRWYSAHWILWSGRSRMT